MDWVSGDSVILPVWCFQCTFEVMLFELRTQERKTHLKTDVSSLLLIGVTHVAYSSKKTQFPSVLTDVYGTAILRCCTKQWPDKTGAIDNDISVKSLIPITSLCHLHLTRTDL